MRCRGIILENEVENALGLSYYFVAIHSTNSKYSTENNSSASTIH
jgi:hypothetical protein